MEQLELLAHGFSVALTGYNIMLMVIGVVIGIMVGVLPGLGAPNGVALLLPLTFSMDPISAMILLTSSYWGALFGGSVTSILFNIPGEPSSLPTTFDGYPMAKEGRAAEAMAFAFSGAAIGAFVGVLLLTFLSVAVAEFSLRFGPAEYVGVYVLAFGSFVGMGGAPAVKTLLAVMVGLAISTIGMDTISGNLRLTFGFSDLMSGISFMVVVIGMLGLGELFITMEDGLKMESVPMRMRFSVVWKAVATLPRYWLALIRSVAVGCWMGIVPGGGATVAAMMSYGLAKRFSPRRANFGKGEPEGIMCPEAADHAAGISALLPTLTLGIPGSGTAAVLLGGLLIWGLQPGPMLFATRPDFVWGLIASIYLGNLIGVIIVMTTAPILVSVLRIPFHYICPVIIIICLIGAYAVATSTFDIQAVVGFALLGYVFKKLDYPIAPLILAIVLGSRTEDAFRQAMILSDGSFGIFWGSPLVSCLTTAGLALACWPLLAKLARLLPSGARISSKPTGV
jgi:TctA family transporter